MDGSHGADGIPLRVTCENCVEISEISVYVQFVSRHVLDLRGGSCPT